MKKRYVAVAVVASVAAVVALAGGSIAQVKAGKSRPLTTKQLMSGHVKPHVVALSDLLKGDGPADDAAWANAATHLALLNETSYTMMDDGRCPAQDWADACMMMRKGSATAIEKIAAKDLAGTREGVGTIMASCAACHSVYHKK
jgi:cytochrome c556